MIGLDAVAMVKKSPRTRYESNGGQLSLKKIYGICKKRMEDISFAESCQILVKAMFECIYAIFQVTEEQKNESVGLFIGKLPGYIQKALSRGSIAA